MSVGPVLRPERVGGCSFIMRELEPDRHGHPLTVDTSGGTGQPKRLPRSDTEMIRKRKCVYEGGITLRRHTIDLFMWGYQPHYRSAMQYLARSVLKELGAGTDVDACVVVVGARRPGSSNLNPVCVEPEDGRWPLSVFDDLLQSIESIYLDHPSQTMFYGDEASMREKPEMMRRDSVSTAVARALEGFDAENGLRSFCGEAYVVDDYYVTPVVQVSEALFQTFPPLEARPPTHWQGGNGYRSLIHAALAAVLDEASQELLRPEPGRSVRSKMRSAEELIRIAARNFMHTPGIAVADRYTYADLFDRFNLISSLLYEGTQGVGHIVLANPSNASIEYVIRFQEPVPFREPRWARKVLQMAAADVALIADSEQIYGLGRLDPTHDHRLQDAFTIDFLDHYHWELSCGSQVLLRSHYGVPQLPFEVIEMDLFTSNYARLFPQSSPPEQSHIWDLFNVVIRQNRGSMIIVAEDAASEARRLAQQGTGIEPVRLTEQLLRRVSGIDGTIILDPTGKCHAIGVILDGAANDECTPSRGSRFNSAVRYVHSASAKRLAIVVSDDRTVDIFPLLRPRISRASLERNIAEFEVTTLDNYHKARSWLDSHRFYLDALQCTRVNAALDRLGALPRDVGEIYISTNPFQVDREWDDSYLTD